MAITFVDTNIIAYARDRQPSLKQSIAETWLKHLAGTREGRISTQVLIEYYAVATHPKKLALPAASAEADCRALYAWKPLSPSLALFESAWALAERYGFSWWDALIVAAAKRLECATLLSEDLQHGLIVDDQLTLINPFLPNTLTPRQG